MCCLSQWLALSRLSVQLPMGRRRRRRRIRKEMDSALSFEEASPIHRARSRALHSSVFSSMSFSSSSSPPPTWRPTSPTPRHRRRQQQQQQPRRARASIGHVSDAEGRRRRRGGEDEVAAAAEGAKIGNPVLRLIVAIAKFSRPHTVYGTAVSILSISFVAASSHPDPAPLLHWSLGFKPVVVSLVSALLANVSIVGLNQIYDIKIDKINKPYLPLASGEISLRTAIALVASTGIAAIGTSVLLGTWPLVVTVVSSLALGAVYSADIPRARWKSNPILAATCIFCVRAVLVQIGFSTHMTLSLGLGLALPAAIQFALVFMCILSVVIACFKDLPDMRGDREAGIMTFSVRDGPEKIFRVSLALITVAYTYAIGTGFMCSILWRKVAIVLSHGFLLWLTWEKTNEVTDMDDPKQLMSFYMFIWKLFYAEYALLPLIV